MKERLLVAQTGFLGDVVLTTPLITTLRRHLDPATLTVLTTPQAKPLLDNHPQVDRVLVDTKRTTGSGLGGLWRTAHHLRRERFTLAVAPHKSLRTALLLALAGIPRRVGVRQSPGWFLYHQTANRDPQRHEVERILCLMRAFGLEPQDCERTVHVAYHPRAASTVRSLLYEAGIRDPDPLFVLCPGSVWATKRWTVEGYGTLARQLDRHYGRVVICGGPEDMPVATAVHEQSGKVGINVSGRSDLQTFMALVDRARVVVSNDSAPMHIAVARNVPVVAIFCATVPSLGYGPYSTRAVVVERRDLFCRPCGRHGGNVCPRGTNECMTLVTVEDVLAGIDHLLARYPAGRAEVHPNVGQ